MFSSLYFLSRLASFRTLNFFLLAFSCVRGGVCPFARTVVRLNHVCGFVAHFRTQAVVTRVLDWAMGAEAASTGLVAYVGDEALHTQPAFIERLAALGDSPPRAVAEIGTDGVYKMIVLCEDDAIAQRLRPKLELLLDAGAELTQALPGYIEVVPTGASKATAAAALLDRWGLTWSDALAIGDGQNDVPMLREAGTSVAMANAKQSVRDAAQFGCASNADDGWVEAMERYVLS